MNKDYFLKSIFAAVLAASTSMASANYDPDFHPASGLDMKSLLTTPLTADSKRLEAMEKSVPGRNVVFMDIDRILSARLFNSQEKSFEDVVAAFLETKGVRLTGDVLKEVTERVENSSSTTGFYTSAHGLDKTSPRREVYIVTTNDPDFSQNVLTSLLLNLPLKSNPDLTPKENYKPRQMNVISDTHELWHARDRKFFPALDRVEAKQWAIIEAKHKAEMFADVAMLLELAVKGDTDSLEKVRNIRYTKTLGNKASAPSQQGNPSRFSGVTHYTAPGIEALALHIKKTGRKTIASYTRDDIRRVAEEITERNALDATLLAVLDEYLGEKPDAYLADLQKLAAQHPDKAKLQEALSLLQSFHDKAPLARDATLANLGNAPKRKPAAISSFVGKILDSPEAEHDRIIRNAMAEKARTLGGKPVHYAQAWGLLTDEIRAVKDANPGIESKMPEIRSQMYKAWISLTQKPKDPDQTFKPS
ncbi:MAG TPA: hypothetical protein VIF12_03235 [Micavibrio sp.]